MSKALSRLLAKPESEVAKTIARLEAKCGYPSEDVRLLAENKQKMRVKIAQLGLDSDDTTAKELYFALLGRFRKDSAAVDRALSIYEHSGIDERIEKAAQLAAHAIGSSETWLVKNSLAKTMIAKNPPMKVARQLHYRSTASLVKREDIAEIFLAADALESATWQNKFSKQFSKVTSSDYELRPVRIVKLLARKWGNVKDSPSHVVDDRRIGAVTIWPSADLKKASVLALTLLLLDGMHRINPQAQINPLHQLHPALLWWANCHYLIYNYEDDPPVSLNPKDIAINFLKEHDHKEAVSHNASHSLWHELMERYQQVSESLSEATADIESDFGQSVLHPNLPEADELAAEYAMVEE